MNFLSPYLMYIKLGVVALIVAVVYFYGVNHQKQKDELEKARIIEQARVTNDKLIKKLENDHEQAVKALNIAMSVPTPRVFIPTCPSTQRPATGSVHGGDADRVLSGRIEKILDEGRFRVKGIVGACESELRSCQVIKEWAKKQ